MNKIFLPFIVIGFTLIPVIANAQDMFVNNIKEISIYQAKDMGLIKSSSIVIRDSKNFSSLMEKIDLYVINHDAKYYTTSVFSFGNKDNYLANVTIYK